MPGIKQLYWHLKTMWAFENNVEMILLSGHFKTKLGIRQLCGHLKTIWALNNFMGILQL